MSITLTFEQFTELRDALYSADHGIRAVLLDTRGNDPASLKRARNQITTALATLRAVKRHEEDAVYNAEVELLRLDVEKPFVEPLHLTCGHSTPVMHCDACRSANRPEVAE